MKNLICKKCNKKFESIRERCGHETYCGKKKIRCPICLNEYTQSGLKRHMISHEKDSYCKECGELIYNFKGKKKFCSRKCSAKYNKKRRERKTNFCLFCNNETFNQKYCSSKCQREYEWINRKEKYIKCDCISDPRQRRKFLIERDGNICKICGLAKWNCKDIPLVADHIDGNSDNNSISNLRLICCNCDAQLPTYKSKNIGNGRAYRRKRYKENKSY